MQSVVDFGADPSGSLPCDANFAAASAATNGRYYIPNGKYKLAEPDPAAAWYLWNDHFVTGDSVEFHFPSGTTYASFAFWGPWQFRPVSSQYFAISYIPTGADVFQIAKQDLTYVPTAHLVYQPFNIIRDSHSLIFEPVSASGYHDLLFRRSYSNADQHGNRFSISFHSDSDVWRLNYATASSGSPNFDSAITLQAGPSAFLEFTALPPQFSMGFTVKQRAAGGFTLQVAPSATDTKISEKGGSELMRFRSGAIGFFGAAGNSRATVTGSKTDGTALASLLSALEALGLITDDTT